MTVLMKKKTGKTKLYDIDGNVVIFYKGDLYCEIPSVMVEYDEQVPQAPRRLLDKVLSPSEPEPAPTKIRRRLSMAADMVDEFAKGLEAQGGKIIRVIK